MTHIFDHILALIQYQNLIDQTPNSISLIPLNENVVLVYKLFRNLVTNLFCVQRITSIQHYQLRHHI